MKIAVKCETNDNCRQLYSVIQTVRQQRNRHTLTEAELRDTEALLINRLIVLDIAIEYSNADGIDMVITRERSNLVYRFSYRNKQVFEFTTSLRKPKSFPKTPVLLSDIQFVNTDTNATTFLTAFLELFRKSLFMRQVPMTSRLYVSHSHQQARLELQKGGPYDTCYWALSVDPEKYVKILIIAGTQRRTLAFTKYDSLLKDIQYILQTKHFVVSTVLT